VIARRRETLVDTSEAARVLRVTPRHVRQLVARGVLDPVGASSGRGRPAHLFLLAAVLDYRDRRDDSAT
jgi:predicted ArsR family transcriptional regulator